jgi:hypothetical protein
MSGRCWPPGWPHSAQGSNNACRSRCRRRRTGVGHCMRLRVCPCCRCATCNDLDAALHSARRGLHPSLRTSRLSVDCGEGKGGEGRTRDRRSTRTLQISPGGDITAGTHHSRRAMGRGSTHPLYATCPCCSRLATCVPTQRRQAGRAQRARGSALCPARSVRVPLDRRPPRHGSRAA